jgi:hypothetical protein
MIPIKAIGSQEKGKIGKKRKKGYHAFWKIYNGRSHNGLLQKIE